MSAFVFDALDIERRGMVLHSPPLGPPSSPPLRLIFPAVDETMNRCYLHFAHVDVNVIALCRALVSAALQSAHFQSRRFHCQTAAIIHSALLSSSDSGRICSLLDNETAEKRAGGQNCDGPPLTEAGISSLSFNISRPGECDCLNTREKRGSRGKSGERTIQKKQL